MLSVPLNLILVNIKYVGTIKPDISNIKCVDIYTMMSIHANCGHDVGERPSSQELAKDHSCRTHYPRAS